MMNFKSLHITCVYFLFCVCLMGHNSKAEAQSPKTADAYFYSGFEKSALGSYEEAIDDYNKAIEIDPQNAKFYLFRGLAKEKLGRYVDEVDGADDDFIKAARMGPEYLFIYLNKRNSCPQLLM